MKIEQLRIKNFKGIENLEIRFNDKANYFVGVNGSGKTTVLEAIWAGFKGISENDKGGNIIGDRYHFIGNKASSAKIDIFVKDENKKVSVTTTIGKSGNVMEFRDENGMSIDGSWVKNLLDVTMMNATQFCKLSAKEQAIRLGIDLSEFNARMEKKKKEFTEQNAILRSYGSLKAVDPVEKVSIEKLMTDKNEIRARLNEAYKKNVQHNAELRKKHTEDQEAADLLVDEFNLEQTRRTAKITDSKNALELLKNSGYAGKEVLNFINALLPPETEKVYVKLKEPEYIVEMPNDQDIKDIDNKIQQAASINELAAQYENYLKSKSAKENVEKLVAKIKADQVDIETEKLAYIKAFNFGFAGLEVDEEGGLVLNGRALSTYSGAEREIIVARLAESQNPELKVRIIDEFQDLDNVNQERLVNELLDNGYQLLIAEVGEPGIPKHENTVFLQECKIVTGEKETPKNTLL